MTAKYMHTEYVYDYPDREGVSDRITPKSTFEVTRVIKGEDPGDEIKILEPYYLTINEETTTLIQSSAYGPSRANREYLFLLVDVDKQQLGNPPETGSGCYLVNMEMFGRYPTDVPAVRSSAESTLEQFDFIESDIYIEDEYATFYEDALNLLS